MFTSQVAQRFVRKTQNRRNFSINFSIHAVLGVLAYENTMNFLLRPLTSVGAICGMYDGYCRNSDNDFRFLTMFSSTVSGAFFGVGAAVIFPISIPFMIIYQLNME